MTFVHCHWCRRLLIVGQACSCERLPDMACDCTYDGNAQVIGPGCRDRIRDAWARVVRPDAPLIPYLHN